MNQSNSSTINRYSAEGAFRTAAVIFIANLFSAGGWLYISLQFGYWQLYLLTGLLAAFSIVAAIAMMLMRRGKPEMGGWIITSGVIILLTAGAFLYSGVALVAGISVIILANLVANQILTPKAQRQVLIISILAGILTALLDQSKSEYRLFIPEIQGILPVITGLSTLLLIFFITRQSWNAIIHLLRSSISNRLTTMVMVLTIPVLIAIAAYISFQAGSEIKARALHNLQQNNQSLATNVSTWFELHARSAKEMALLPDIISMDAARQKPTLEAISLTHPNLFLVQTTDLNGINVSRSDDAELNDYHDRAWFLGARQGAPITAEALISRTIGKPALNIATPIYDESGKIVGVASIVSELSEISKEVLNIENGQGITFIVDANNRVVAHPDPTYTENELRDLSTYPPVVALDEGKIGQITFTDENNVRWIAFVDRLDNGWGIISQQPEAELLASVRQFQTVAGILILFGSLLTFIFVWFAIRRTLQPIGELTSTVSAIAAGDSNLMAEVRSQDEIGLLASTFNDMTTKLRESFATLEQRVTDRTHNLELAAQVSRTVSQVRALEVMLTDAAELIRTQFDLYYVQVYLTNPSQTYLNLQAGTGHVGTELLSRNHRLPLNTGSINGRAAVEKKSVVFSDTTTSANFRPNPLLPNTRSEMAVPLMIGERVVGVLDMQSEHSGSLSQDVLPAFEALAGQLAIAIQNAALLAEAELARTEVEAQAQRLSRSNWTEYLDAIHKPEETGFVFEQNKVIPLSQAKESQLSANSLSVPIEVTGETLGNLVVEMDEHSPISHTPELVNTVARQVAQQIESLRLLESAERFRMEAEASSRRIAREDWQEYKQSADKTMSYLYDLKEVRPYNQNENMQLENSDFSLPLRVRNEKIGQVTVQGLKTNDLDNLELAGAVVERLSQHIESLRLLEQTEESRSEIQQSQVRLSEALEIAKLANWEYDVEKDLFTFNDNFYSIFHTNVEEVGSYQLPSSEYSTRFVHPEDVPVVGIEIGKALNSTERHYSASLEHRVLFADGGIGYISVNVHVERDEEGKIIRYYGANQDVTERRKAEEELRSREAQLSAVLMQTEKLFEASRRLTQVSDLQELVKITVEIFNIPVINGAELDMFSYDSNGELETLSVIANWWNGTGKAPGAIGSHYAKEMFSAIKLFLTSTPVFISDALDSERVDAGMLRIVKAFSIRAVTFLPLFVGTNQIGVLVMHAEEPHDFTEEETRLFSGLAPQIATVLDNRRQFERAQQQAERESKLNVISQKIQNATTVEAVLQIAARELGHALGAPMTVAQLSMKDRQ